MAHRLCSLASLLLAVTLISAVSVAADPLSTAHKPVYQNATYFVFADSDSRRVVTIQGAVCSITCTSGEACSTVCASGQTCQTSCPVSGQAYCECRG
jgi:hypothetical protein